MVINFITRDGDDDMNISYVNSNKTTSLPVELDALNNKDISYAKDFFLYIETQLKIAKDFYLILVINIRLNLHKAEKRVLFNIRI